MENDTYEEDRNSDYFWDGNIPVIFLCCFVWIIVYL